MSDITVEIVVAELSKRETVEINFYGARIEVLSREEAARLAESIVRALVPEENYCRHDWSFPPKVCPVCNKRVKIKATFVDELI